MDLLWGFYYCIYVKAVLFLPCDFTDKKVKTPDGKNIKIYT